MYTRANTGLELNNVRTLLGATFRNDYVTLQADIDVLDPDLGVNGMC
jgi:hypothetical protein